MLSIGLCFFGLFLVGVGLQHFITPGFRPFLIPDTSGLPGLSLWTMVLGSFLILAGLAQVKKTDILLAACTNRQ